MSDINVISFEDRFQDYCFRSMTIMAHHYLKKTRGPHNAQIIPFPKLLIEGDYQEGKMSHG